MEKRRAAAVSVPIATHADGSEAQCWAKLERLRIQWARHRDVDEQFIETLNDLKRIRAWERIPPEQPYGSLDAMSRAELGVPVAMIERSVTAFLSKNGGDRRSDKFQFDNCQTETPSALGGNSVVYLRALLVRDNKPIADALARGEFRSVRQAAIAAGIVTPKPTVTHRATPEGFYDSAKKHLTADQIEHLVEMLEAAP